jgi:hypothetical protein
MPVATGVVGDLGRPAVRALLDMTAQGRRPACRDGADDAMLDAAHVYAMSLSVSFAVAAEDLRQLERGAHVCRFGRRGLVVF